MIISTTSIIRDAATGSDFWQAAGAAGGAKEVHVLSDQDDGTLHRTAEDLLAWVEGDEGEPVGTRDAIRRELRFLVHRARTRARLRARQFSRRATIRVALTREGDHLLAQMTED